MLTAMQARRIGLARVLITLAGAFVMAAFGADTALAQAPGLPRTYQVKRIDSPVPVRGAAFGRGMASAE
jgi:hypothetical protein